MFSQFFVFPVSIENYFYHQERQKIVRTLLDRLSKKSLPVQEEVLRAYNRIMDKFTDPETKKINFTVFPSFYVMLERLRKMNIPFTIILRTFGSDLPEVVKEIEEHRSGVKITRWAKFEGKNFSIEGKETIKNVEEHVEEIFDLFLTSKQHFAVRDDWFKWNQDGERGQSGKPFPYDSSGNRREVRNLSVFFDDNITGDEQDIVQPCEIVGKTAPTKALLDKLIFPVNTQEAMSDDNYYIDRVLQAIKCSGILL